MGSLQRKKTKTTKIAVKKKGSKSASKVKESKKPERQSVPKAISSGSDEDNDGSDSDDGDFQSIDLQKLLEQKLEGQFDFKTKSKKTKKSKPVEDEISSAVSSNDSPIDFNANEESDDEDAETNITAEQAPLSRSQKKKLRKKANALSRNLAGMDSSSGAAWLEKKKKEEDDAATESKGDAIDSIFGGNENIEDNLNPEDASAKKSGKSKNLKAKSHKAAVQTTSQMSKGQKVTVKTNRNEDLQIEVTAADVKRHQAEIAKKMKKQFMSSKTGSIFEDNMSGGAKNRMPQVGNQSTLETVAKNLITKSKNDEIDEREKDRTMFNGAVRDLREYVYPNMAKKKKRQYNFSDTVFHCFPCIILKQYQSRIALVLSQVQPSTLQNLFSLKTRYEETKILALGGTLQKVKPAPYAISRNEHENREKKRRKLMEQDKQLGIQRTVTNYQVRTHAAGKKKQAEKKKQARRSGHMEHGGKMRESAGLLTILKR